LTELDPRTTGRAASQDKSDSPYQSDGAHQFRAGGRVLSLFTTTLHGVILHAISDGPVRFSDLQARAGESTLKALRGNIGNLIGIGALEKRTSDSEPDLLDNELTPFGRELLLVAATLDEWLARAPGSPLELEGEAAKDAIKALLGGWNSRMLRVLAARSSSLAELDELLGSFSQSALERRLAAMHAAGQVTACSPPDGGPAAYAVTEWLREGAAPLLASIRCERRHLGSGTAAVGRTDVETLFLLAVPLLDSFDGARGRCQLAVDVGDSRAQGSAGVDVAVEGGRVVSCVAKLESDPPEWVRGSAAEWLDAIIDRDPRRLETGGPDGLPAIFVEGLHSHLFSGADAPGR
jgi:DNA-binding HxlR family transcriptional regulator